MSHVLDACMVFNELDMLDLRLHLLDSVVDTFVIVEAGMTHSGQPKPAIVGDALQTERFRPFADKIVYSFTRDLQGANSWERERYNRSLISDTLAYVAQPGDFVVVGDVDEIVDPTALSLAHYHRETAVVFQLDFYYYSFSYRVRQGWGIGGCRWRLEQDANKIRRGEFPIPPVALRNAGFHASYFMTPEQVVEKLDAFMHHADVARDVPRDPIWIAERMKAGQDLFGRAVQIDYDPTPELPAYVQAHRAQYEALGWVEAEKAQS